MRRLWVAAASLSSGRPEQPAAWAWSRAVSARSPAVAQRTVRVAARPRASATRSCATGSIGSASGSRVHSGIRPTAAATRTRYGGRATRGSSGSRIR